MLAVEIEHKPVLLEESVGFLNVRPGGVYVDCTVGMGGHSRLIASMLEGRGSLIALDRDTDSLELARAALEEYSPIIHFHKENFKNLPLVLAHLGLPEIDGCLVDLGVSRYQLTDKERGFSFREDGPLDMRMDRQQITTAEQLVNNLTAQELAEIFFRHGEEPQARKIASAIVKQRQVKQIRSTKELSDLVSAVKGFRRHQKIHPATQVFQALRIEVNQELADLDRFLDQVISLLSIGGRLVVISFHSLEDRIVKRTFKAAAGKCICFRPGDLCTCPRVKRVELLNKKPITPSDKECEWNPSARSSKLRALKRVAEEII